MCDLVRGTRLRLLLVTIPVLTAVLGLCGCSDSGDDGIKGVGQVPILEGTPVATKLHTWTSPAKGRNILVVSGVIGDLPGLSDAVRAIQGTPLTSGRLSLIPEAYTPAIRAGTRTSGDCLNRSFGAETLSDDTGQLVTVLQSIADTSDVLIVLTDMQEDAGNTLFYSPDANAETVSTAQRVVRRINRNLDSLKSRTGEEFEPFYTLRSDHAESFLGWAGKRTRPSLALEFALFGGRDETLTRNRQRKLAQIALDAVLKELGVLALESAPVRETAVVKAPPPAESAPATDFSNQSGLRYILDDRRMTHVPGDLWVLPDRGALRIAGLHGLQFRNVRLDITGIGDDDDTGTAFSIEALPGSGPRLAEIRYLRGKREIWSELVMIGGPQRARMVLQDTLGTNPWISSFPSTESWLYLVPGELSHGTTACPACDIPSTVRLIQAPDRTIVGKHVVIRVFHLDLIGRRVGELLSVKWKDRSGTGLVDITDLNATHNLLPPIAVEMKYATNDNFLKTDLYDGVNRCLIKKDVAEALVLVQRGLSAQGLGLKVLDGYRPHSVQYKMWKIKPETGYVASPERGSNHNRGAAVDVTLVDFDGRDQDMPTAFDTFTKKAWQDATEDLTPREIQNRLTLRTAMTMQGFSAIRKEWWHYDGPGSRKHRKNIDIPLTSGYERRRIPEEWEALHTASH
jgi:zinc D-Ala-D-Ala dipeptidase